MNLLCLSEMYFPHGGGAETATYLYNKLLESKGVEIKIITNKFAGELNNTKHGNMQIYRIPIFAEGKSSKYALLSRLDLYLSSTIRKMFRWADIIYIPRQWYSAIPLAKLYKKPVVVHLHDYIPLCPMSIFYNMATNAICHKNLMCQANCIISFERAKNIPIKDVLISLGLNTFIGKYVPRIISLSDAVICVSYAQQRIITEAMPNLTSKTRVIYNPLPEISYTKTVGEGFGYFGGTNPAKGYQVLLKALQEMKPCNTKLLQLHATQFPDFYNGVTRLIKDNVLIKYHSKLMFSGKDREIYSQIQTVVFPSVCQEPLSYVVAETLLNSRILIASRVGGVPEQVDGCKGAFLFENGNYKQLAESIEFVSSLNMETKHDLGCHNRDIFLKKFRDERSLDQFMNICQKLISESI